MSAWPAPLSLRLQPGHREAIVRSPRPDLPALLALGQPAEGLPERMAALHALCAHGHRLAATLAVRAARGEVAICDAADRMALRHAVAREQLLRMTHDWPRLLPGVPTAGPALNDCPLWQRSLAPAQQLQALPHWLQQRWLGRPVAALALALEAPDAAARALAWARATPTPPAALLAAALPRALALHTPTQPGDEPDTGPWNRRSGGAAAAADNAGMRLLARLHDLLRLAEPGGDDWLWVEASAAEPGEGRAAVEVGRGLLRYRVRVDAEGVLRGLQLQAPTDANFHPHGVLARALRDVSDPDDARLLAVAFDPCEPFDVVMQPEPAHA